jgi:AP endonuclease-1
MPSTIGKRASRGDISPPTTKRQKRQSTTKEVKYQDTSDEDAEVLTPKKASKSPKKKTPVKISTVLKETTQANGVKTETEIKEEIKKVNGAIIKKTTVEKTTVKRKRKTADEKEAETMALAARTVGSKILVGAHVSAAGGMFDL